MVAVIYMSIGVLIGAVMTMVIAVLYMDKREYKDFTAYDSAKMSCNCIGICDAPKGNVTVKHFDDKDEYWFSLVIATLEGKMTDEEANRAWQEYVKEISDE